MASTWPAKNNYATGDVLTAANMNGVGDDLNDVYNFSGYAAGKNKILNSDFGIWQRGTSFTNPTVNQYVSDRWYFGGGSNLTGTISAQTFTAGTAPVSGYEGTYFYRITGTATTPTLQQPIEDVRTFAGQTVTISFWAKASTNLSLGSINLYQNFGSGGSAGVNNTSSGASIDLTTSWQRFSKTITIASISGKTIGTNSSLTAIINMPNLSSTTIDFWGVQLEAGSTASIFQTATGTKQGELAACQRYYWRAISGGLYGALGISGYVVNATTANINVNYPVLMRTTPTSVDYSTLTIQDSAAGLYTISAVGINTDITNNYIGGLNITISGATSGRWARMLGNNSATAYIGFSAEL